MKEDHDCSTQVSKDYCKAFPKTAYVRFDLTNIISFDKRDLKQTGQRCWIMKEGAKKEEKTFMVHTYCPWCGEKYPD